MKSHDVILLSTDIDLGEGISDIKEHVTSMGIGWIVGSSPEAGIKYGIRAIPTLVIINKDGKIVKTFVGVTNEDALLSAVRTTATPYIYSVYA